MSEGKYELTMADFYEQPAWYLDDEADLHYPVLTMDEKVSSIDDFRFRAAFVTRAGDDLEGCISGLGDVAISFFRNGRWYSASTQWKDATIAQVDALIADSPALKARTVEDFFPVKFRTLINREPYIDHHGEFWV